MSTCFIGILMLTHKYGARNIKSHIHKSFQLWHVCDLEVMKSKDIHFK